VEAVASWIDSASSFDADAMESGHDLLEGDTELHSGQAGARKSVRSCPKHRPT
jgi:hypothetical protein